MQFTGAQQEMFASWGFLKGKVSHACEEFVEARRESVQYVKIQKQKFDNGLLCLILPVTQIYL